MKKHQLKDVENMIILRDNADTHFANGFDVAYLDVVRSCGLHLDGILHNEA